MATDSTYYRKTPSPPSALAYRGLASGFDGTGEVTCLMSQAGLGRADCGFNFLSLWTTHITLHSAN